jgi:hypothetical protein
LDKRCVGKLLEEILPYSIVVEYPRKLLSKHVLLIFHQLVNKSRLPSPAGAGEHDGDAVLEHGFHHEMKMMMMIEAFITHFPSSFIQTWDWPTELGGVRNAGAFLFVD